jgi:carotenoid cleavage dioxygenase
MMHDFALTSGHAIFMDLPVLLDFESWKRGTMPFAWSDTYGARLGILPRGGGIDALRWVQVDPCYVFHVANAYEEPDGTIVMDVAWYRELWRGGPSASTFESAVLKRWRVAPRATRAEEEAIDDRPLEFPRVSEGRVGLPHRMIYAVGTGGEPFSVGSHTLLRYDMRSRARTERKFDDTLPSEFAFVHARSDASEDEGWLLGYVYEAARDASAFMIFDAQDIAGSPVARIPLNWRVPQGFHGNWFPAPGAQ